MSLKICLMGLLCLYFSAGAHAQYTIHPLKVGDSIPDVTIGNLINYKADHVRLSEFKDKLLVLDFWATYCGSCIAEFPEEVQLQKRYGQDVQFLLVDTKAGRDTKSKLRLFFTSYHTSYSTLPCAAEDTTLIKFFPHQNVGYYVWIKNNKVVAMTDEQALIAQNVRSFIAGSTLKASTFTDIPYHIQQPLFVNGNGGDAPSLLYRSSLMPYKPGLKTSSSYMSDAHGNIVGCQFVNASMLDLYIACDPRLQSAEFNRVLLKVRHPENLSRDSTSERWKAANRFIYQASYPPTTRSHAISLMCNDFARYFGFNISQRSITVNCMVVRSVRSRTGLNHKAFSEKRRSRDSGYFRSFPISAIVHDLNTRSAIPFVDETAPGLSIRLPIEHDDLTNEELIAILKSHGIAVEAAKRKLKYIVISEAETTN